MMKRSPILSLVAVASFTVLWFVLDADLHFIEQPCHPRS